MAEDNHDGIDEILRSLQENENPATLLPTFTSQMNDSTQQLPNPKPDLNLQLSLGGFYCENPNSAQVITHPSAAFTNRSSSSVMKRSYLEQNNIMQTEMEEEIKIISEIEVTTRPNNPNNKRKKEDDDNAETSKKEKSSNMGRISLPPPDDNLPSWAAQSASLNPAFKRAIEVIKSDGCLQRTSRSCPKSGSRTSKKPNPVEGFGIQHQFVSRLVENGNSTLSRSSLPTSSVASITKSMLESIANASALMHTSRAKENGELSKFHKLLGPANFSGASANGKSVVINSPSENVKLAAGAINFSGGNANGKSIMIDEPLENVKLAAAMNLSGASANGRLFMHHKPPKNMQFETFADFSDTHANSELAILAEALQNVDYVSSFNFPSAAASRAAAFPTSNREPMISWRPRAPFSLKEQIFPSMAQNAIDHHGKGLCSSMFFSNSNAAAGILTNPFLPFGVTSNMNAQATFPMLHEPNWAMMPLEVLNSIPPLNPFQIPPAVKPFQMQVLISGSRMEHDSISPFKRAKLHNHQIVIPPDKTEFWKQMPVVGTTGGKPNGKITYGFLYKYGRDEEVIIICFCHGRFFSPHAFVRHAGGGYVDNPSQLICVMGYL